MRKSLQSAMARILLTYSVSCFVILQLLDILLEPLGIPIIAIRWVMLLMLSAAPLLVLIVSWRRARGLGFEEESSVVEETDVVFNVGIAAIDTKARQIRFNNVSVDVQPKVFDLIEYLIRARDRVVSKDELFDEIWPAVVVSEASLTQTIKRARDLFRSQGFECDVIRTVSRKGYQFDYAVTKSAEQVPMTKNTWNAVVLPTGVVAILCASLALLIASSSDTSIRPASVEADDNSLVVLPFENLTSDTEFSYFSDGLTETLTSSLTRVSGLKVIARASSFSLRDAANDFSTIGQELNVAHVVQGSVQRDEELLRITARLIRASDGAQEWSRTYNREFDDIFIVQDNITRDIVEQMSEVLTSSLQLPAPSEVTASSPEYAEAYRLLLKGRDIERNGSSEGMRLAEVEYRAALALRPDYPEALVALSNVIRVRTTLGDLSRETGFAEALSLAIQATRIEPDYDDAYVHIGEIQHRHFWDFEAADESYQRALTLNPGNAQSHSAYSRFLSKSGKYEAAVREARIALDLDPRSARSATSLVIRLIRARQLEEARTVINELSARFPDLADIPWLETNWHIRSGNFSDALQWVALEELDYLRLSLSAVALYSLGREEQAQLTLNELIETDADGSAFQIGEVYAYWEQTELAFEWLEKAFSLGDPGLSELYSSTILETLHSDSRFIDLAERVGLPPLPTEI